VSEGGARVSVADDGMPTPPMSRDARGGDCEALAHFTNDGPEWLVGARTAAGLERRFKEWREERMMALK